MSLEQTQRMGKLSKILLKSIIFTAVQAQDDRTFQVTSCNADVSLMKQRPLYPKQRPLSTARPLYRAHVLDSLFACVALIRY